MSSPGKQLIYFGSIAWEKAQSDGVDLSKSRSFASCTMLDAGAKVDELQRRHGIGPTTYRRWCRKYGGREVSEAQRLTKTGEKRRLKRLGGDQAVNVQVLQELLKKSW